MIYLHEKVTCLFCNLCALPIIRSYLCKICLKDYHKECFNTHSCKLCRSCEEGNCLNAMIRKGKNKIEVLREKQDERVNLDITLLLQYREKFEEVYNQIKKGREQDTDSIVKKITNYKGSILHKEIKNREYANKIITYYTDYETFTYFWKKIYYILSCEICCSNFHSSSKTKVKCKKCEKCFNCGESVNESSCIFHNYEIGKNVGIVKYMFCKNCYEKYVITNEVCPVCIRAYTQEDMIECDWCLRWIHYDCENNKDIITAIDSNTFKNVYKCQVCEKFENCWLGKRKSDEIKATNEDVGDNRLVKNIVEAEGSKMAECYICVRKFNLEESKIVKLVKVQSGMTTKYAHNVCALSHIKTTENGKIYISPKSGTCKYCKKRGATFRCVLCRDIYYHYDCAFFDRNDLFRSNYIFPICEIHSRKHLEKINEITNHYYQCDFYETKETAPVSIRTGNYNINADRTFDILIYHSQQTIVLKCDYKHFYLNDTNLTSDEIISRFEKLGININFIDAIYEGIKLYNAYCFVFNLPTFDLDTQKYNNCINKKFQQNNYTNSYLSSMLSQKTSLYKDISNIHGFGIFAGKFYVPGDIIIAYEGHLVNNEKADQLEKDYSHLDHYLFKSHDKVIDATYMGNLAKFINQSCNPNSFSTNATWGNKKGILICAQKFITIGEEITYKYGFNGKKMRCNCNAFGCKQTLN